MAFGYYRVAIKHIKQTRSEAIIQPEVPISDLFPAIASECSDTNGFIKGEGKLFCSTVDDNRRCCYPGTRGSMFFFCAALQCLD